MGGELNAVVSVFVGVGLSNSRRHHARTDIVMRDEISDMDYPTYPK